MTQPVQEPSQGRTERGQDWRTSQLFRRPSVAPGNLVVVEKYWTGDRITFVEFTATDIPATSTVLEFHVAAYGAGDDDYLQFVVNDDIDAFDLSGFPPTTSYSGDPYRWTLEVPKDAVAPGGFGGAGGVDDDTTVDNTFGANVGGVVGFVQENVQNAVKVTFPDRKNIAGQAEAPAYHAQGYAIDGGGTSPPVPTVAAGHRVNGEEMVRVAFFLVGATNGLLDDFDYPGKITMLAYSPTSSTNLVP